MRNKLAVQEKKHQSNIVSIPPQATKWLQMLSLNEVGLYSLSRFHLMQ